MRIYPLAVLSVASLLAGPLARPQAPSPPTAPAQRAAPARTYVNPVWDHDFPDPFLLRDGATFYAYATETPPYRFQVMRSPDLVHWTHEGTAFRVPWARAHYWAPEVVHYAGRFYMTYSALNPATNKHDIGIAVADTPLGPFQHLAKLVEAGAGQRGVIDADVFVERDGTPYLVYSEENPRRIVLRRMARDLKSVDAEVTELVKPDRPWERGVNEAPTLIRRNGVYHLFFSAGFYQGSKEDSPYCVCHASSRSLRGRYVKDPEPLLKTVPGKVYGPGHQCVIELPSGEWWMAYHGWDDRGEPHYGANPAGRTLRIDRLTWRGDTPVMHGPTTTPQPAPRVRPARARDMQWK